MSEWQSIETAPKHGIKILVWLPSVGVVVAAWGDNYWEACWDNDELARNVTHWQELPAPPETTAAATRLATVAKQHNNCLLSKCRECEYAIAHALDNAGVAKMEYAARKTVEKVFAMYEIERNEFQTEAAKEEARRWVYAAVADLRDALAVLTGTASDE